MPLITTSFPDLTGGVSQQPSAQRLLNQGEAQENAMSLLIGGLTKRPPTNHVSELTQSGGASVDLSGAFTHFIQRDADERYVLSITADGTIYVHGIDGDFKNVYLDTAESTIPYLVSSTPKTSLKAITIADVTFLLNTEKTAALKTGSSDLSPYSRAQAAAPNEALLWVKTTLHGIKLTAKVSTGAASSTDIEVLHTATISSSDNVYLPAPGTSVLAQALATGATPSASIHGAIAATTSGLNGISGMTATHEGSVVFMSRTTDFNVTVDDSLGQKAISVIKDEVQDFGDLPPIAKDGMILLVKGEPESLVDDYYVKFETNGGAVFGNGIWVETIGPGIEYQWDYSVMPHIMVRQPNDTFMIKETDGTTPDDNTNGDIDWASFKFLPREVGSNLTNPLPSFHEKKITALSFFKGRLAILSGENCALSETGYHFNFFRTTTTQLLDTAPIDVGVGGTELNKLENAEPFSDRLILFSERAQFALQGEAILSPMTASVTRATNFDATTGADPVPAGSSMFFAFNRGSFSGIREFYKTNETDINFDAVEATAQAPKYVEGTVKKLTSSPMEDILVVQATPTDTLYIYKYFKTERGRAQSAWSKFIFNNAEIIDIEFVQQSLYILMKRGTQTHLERMDLQTGLTDVGATYTTLLDRRIEVLGDGEDDPSGGFTINLENEERPRYEIGEGETPQVVSEDGELMVIASSTSSTITLVEEFAASDKFYVGIPYTMRYQLSEPVLKRANERGGVEMMVSGRHQLRYMTVVYDQTAYFKVKITPELGGTDGTTLEYPFSGRFLSTGGYLGSLPSSSGDFRFPVFTQSDSVKIEIENDSPLPSNLQSVEFEAQYTSRSQRT